MAATRCSDRRALALGAAVAPWLALAGCRSFGARQVPLDRFDYNQAIAQSTNEQMLLNVVRLRYSEVPVFLAVNSVLTQYVYSGSIGVEGQTGESLGDAAWSVAGSAGVVYVERPTITYSPLSGQEFAAQLLAPVPSDLVFGLVQSGWPPDQLLSMMLQRVNDLEFASLSAEPTAADRERSAAFAEAVGLVIDAAAHESIEMHTDDKGTRYLVFRQDPDAAAAHVVDRLKQVIGLDRGQSRFRVTTQVIGRDPDEVTVKVRSLLGLMGFLSHGVLVPAEHAAAVAGDGLAEDLGPGPPFHVQSQSERPDDAFIAVRHAGYWFFIPRSDHESKRAFGLLTYLFQMQAPQMQGAGPLLTVPAG
jgi:hypothetical protein